MSHTKIPDHTQLPDSDDSFAVSFFEHPQSMLLTDSIQPVLQQLYPDDQYIIGQDSGIYWHMTDPLKYGAVAPDWFLVLGVPPILNGEMRRSYVLAHEFKIPLIVLEFTVGNGEEENDNTPLSKTDEGGIIKPGKFWLYEQVLHIPYYGIYEVTKNQLRIYRWVDLSYHILEANEHGRYPIPPLGLELGIWKGIYQQQCFSWLRWWGSDGQILPTGHERAKQIRQFADKKAEMWSDAIPKLAAMGLSATQIAEALDLPVRDVKQRIRQTQS